MDRRIGWYQPEQQGPSTTLWTKILNNSALSFQQLQVSENMNGAKFSKNGRAPDFISLNNDSFRYIVEEKTNNNPFAGRKDNLASTYDWNNTGNKDNGTPWRIQGKVYEEGVVGLHQEIEDFYRFMYPRPEEHLMRAEVVERVSAVVRSIWPDARVEIYGSCKTWLYLPTSDIDLVVFGELGNSPWFQLAEELEKSDILEPGSMKVLNGAAIPIVKLTDRFTRVSVDISFNVEGTQECVAVIERFMKEYPMLPILTIILKQFLLQRYLNEVFYGGISSYSLICLIVSFLQRHVPPEPLNFGVMLIEFFELYGVQFNYFRTYISLEDGGSYCPKDNQIYNLLSIVDPIHPTAYPEIDAGRSCHGIMEVRKAFHYAYLVLQQAVLPHLDQDSGGNSILGRIIRVTDEVINHRLWVQRMWGPKVYAMPYPFRTPNFIIEQQAVPVIVQQPEDTALRIPQSKPQEGVKNIDKPPMGVKNNNNDEMCVNENNPPPGVSPSAMPGGSTVASSSSSCSSSSSADVQSSSSDSESDFSSQASSSGSSKETPEKDTISISSEHSTDLKPVTNDNSQTVTNYNPSQCNATRVPPVPGDANKSVENASKTGENASKIEESVPHKTAEVSTPPRTGGTPHIQVTVSSVQKSEIQTSVPLSGRDANKSNSQRNSTNQTVTSRTYHNRNLNYHPPQSASNKYNKGSAAPTQNTATQNSNNNDSNPASPTSQNQSVNNKRFKRSRHKKDGNGARRQQPQKY